MEKLLYKGALAIFQCVTEWLLKIMVVYVESFQCSKVNYVSLNQLTISFCTWGEVKGMDLECFVTSYRDTLYGYSGMVRLDSLGTDSSLTSQKM